MFRKRVSSNRLRLPGVSVGVELTDDTFSAGGHPFALVAVPASADHTVVLDVWPLQSGVVADPGLWCDRWRENVQLVEDAPDITAVTAVWDRSGPQVTTRVAVTFRAATKAHRDLAEHAVEIARRLPWLLDSLAQAGLDALPMKGDDIIGWVSDCYSGERVHDHNDDVDSAALPWRGCGPQASTQTRDWFSHDGFVSASWIHQPPQTVTAEVLEHIITDTGGDRVRVAATYRPVGDSEGLLKRFLLTTTITGNGVEPGAGLLRAELPLQARIATRRGCDRHAEVFASSMGIGMVLPEHGSIASHPTRAFREDLPA